MSYLQPPLSNHPAAQLAPSSAGRRLRVFIVDSHTLVREGLHLLLNAQADFQVVGEASDPITILQQAAECQPDLLLLDIHLPELDGLQTLQRVRDRLPEVRTLILTIRQDEEALFQALRAGASGYLLKGADSTEIIEALRAIGRGDFYLSPPLTRLLVHNFLQGWRPCSNSRLEEPTPDVLSAREMEVLQRLAEGQTNAEIAADLFISISTVQTHRSRIMEKLSLKTRADLVKYALRHDLICLD